MLRTRIQKGAAAVFAAALWAVGNVADAQPLPDAGAAAKSAAAVASGFSPVSCVGKKNEIRLIVKNVRQGVGVLNVELYKNDPTTWLRGEGRLVRVKFAARAPVTKVCLYAPEPGDYAIGLYHDKDNSSHLERGAFGIPIEPYGVSNNPRMQFGPPSLRESLFHVPDDSTTVEVKLRG